MKKLVSMILSLVLLMQAFPLVQIAAAEDGKTNQIPEMEIEEEILASDVFYLTAGAAALQEDGGTYLLRIARGGDCASYSGVTVRIADFTAKYGKDYTVSLLEGGEKADSPRENESLLEQMEGSEYTETPMLTEEEYAEMLASDSELQAQMEQGVQDAIDYIESQVSDGEAAEEEPYTLEDVKAAVTEQTDTAEEETSAAAVKETPATPVSNAGSDLQAARALYTGIDAEPQKVTGNADALQQIQDMADVISKAVVGATLQVEFAPGESEKHIAIHVKDNNRGDGDRYFYFMLSEPTGTTTNSAASSCAFTILDDEEQTPSQVSFTQSVYQAEDGQDTVSVEIVRKGALNTIASVHLTADSDDAVAGRDFSPVDTDVMFPIGIDKRTVNIPVCSDNLYQAADVTLTLDEPMACTVTKGSSEISLPAAELPLLGGAAEQAFSLTDIVLGDPVTISSPAETYLDPDHCGGCNFYHQDTPESYYDMVWKDNYSKTAHAFGDKQDGISLARWNLTDGYGADIAGAQIKWECKGKSSQNTVKFAGGDKQSSLSWATPSYKQYKAISKDEPMNFFGNKKFIKQVEVYNYGPGDSWNNTHVFSIKPIYRPFIIELASNYASTAAEEIKFLNADGTQTAWKDAAYLAIAGADNTNNSQVIRYTKEGKNSITFMQTVGGNTQTPYVTLNYVSANSNGQSAVFYKANSTVSNTYTTTLTSNWIGTNYTAIAFEDNNVTGWQNQQSDVHALRGRITLQPHFSYKNATVKLIKPDNDYGYVKMSGAAFPISADTSYTYHRGDIIKLETVINSRYQGIYEPAGYFIRYKQNASDSNWLCTMTIPVNADGAAYLDPNERLQYGYYEVTPLYQLADNTITVRIKDGDEKYFDGNYGLFSIFTEQSIPYTTKTINGAEYRDYSLLAKYTVGLNYALNVRLATGADGYMTWQENGKARQYVGEVFFHEFSNSRDDNIITLSYHSGSAGSSQRYISVSGTVTHPTYSMITHQVSTAGAEPASGALVNFGTGFGIAGADGSFTISPFRVPFDTGTDAYMRYVISLNGQELLKEVKLSTTNASQQTVYHIPDPSKKDSYITELTATVYKQSLQAQSISVENGSILNQIQVTPDSNSTGVITIPKDGTITVNVTVPTNYTYTKYAVVDENGTVAETKNCKETVTGIDLIVCDSTTHQARQSVACGKKNSTLFQGSVDATTVLPGDELYIRVTTDRSRGVYTGADSDEGINSTVYTNAFTGYSFIQKTTDEIPVLQQIDMVPNIAFTELPLIGNTGMNFEFPHLSISLEKTDTGCRLCIGPRVTGIIDLIKGTHMSYFGADNGAYYTDIFSIWNPIQSFKEGLTSAYNDAFTNAKELYSGCTAALGAPQWKIDVRVGVYFDFVYASITDPSTGYVTEGVFDTLYFTGVGGYIGVGGGIKMAWYTLLPVVFIPAYFGIEMSANVLGFFGAEKDTSKPEITFDEASHATRDFNSSINNFKASVKMAACVQIYVGVGLAGTVGLRGGGKFDVMAQWMPSDLVDDWGCALTFTLGIWIDLFLFTIPCEYKFPDIKFGSFEQYGSVVAQALAANANAELTLRQPYSDEASKWVGDKPVVQAGFSPVSTQVIETNAYEHPEAQLLTLSDGRIFMAFLDTDAERAATERTVLKYTIYDNGKWSAPVTVQDDGRADFQPSACEMENGQVMLAWISSDPAEPTTDDAVEYLLGREVYTTVVDTKTGKIDEPTRLTTDNYFDYTPTCVYVPGTGDRVVYYVKASNLVKGADGQTVEMTAEKMANSFANECAVVYMLYDEDEGGWLFDRYLENELELDNEADVKQFIANWKGQRFLKNPIHELGLEVPNVTDFTAMAHGDLSVYAYTIDQDSSNDTQGDKEIFLQFCDLSTHKTYVPIRLTNDNTCDTLPKMVSVKRSGEATDTDLMLFWLRNEKDVAYLNISDLVLHGVDEKGKITEDYLTDDKGNVHSLEELYSYAEIRDNAVKGKTAMADFDVVVHEEDIYIVWTQPHTITDEEGNSKQSREVYASALIRNDSDGGESVASDTSLGISWSDPYQLTNTRNFTDEPHAVINKDGKLMAVYNSYQQELTGDAEHPVEISDFELKATYMEPCGSIEVTDMVFSDPTPMPGDEVEVEMYVKNTGLTLAKDGYSVTVTGPKGSKLTQSDGSELTKITSDKNKLTISSGNKLLPGNTDIYYFTWTIPEKLDDLKLTAVSQETGMNNTHTYESEELVPEPYYAITTPVVYQDNDGFHLLTTVTNEGNLISQKGDFLQVLLVGPYGLDERYESEERIFAEIPIDSLEPGECAEISAVLDVVPDVFDRYGFADCYVAPWNEAGKSLGEGEEIRIMPERPMELQLNNKSVPQMMILSAGSKKEFSMSCDSQRMNENLTVSYSTDDPDVAVFEGNTLHALQPGTVTVTGTVMPYGIEIQPITVSVWPSASDYLEALGWILPAAVKVISLLPVVYASPVKEDEPSSPTKETDKEEQTAQSEQTAETEQKTQSEQTAETEQKTQSETIHQWESEFTLDTPATCTEAGEKSIHCKDCNDRKEITVIPALGHNWDEGTVTIEPTDETVGIMTYTCQRCGETKSENIEPTAESSGEKEQEKTSGIATWQILTAAGVAAAAIAVAIIIIRRKKIH